MDKIYWNENLQTDGNVLVNTRSGPDDGSGGFGAWTAWSADLTTPTGSTIATSADRYFQFRIKLSTTDTTGVNYPYIFKAEGFNVKFTYYQVESSAEDNVEFRYKTGWRNYGDIFADKLYKKIISMHEGDTSDFKMIMRSGMQDSETQSTEDLLPAGKPNPFDSIDLTVYPKRFMSNLPPNMFGKEFDIEWYKNDTESFKVKQYAVMIEHAPVF
jgi:hypothetical protein